MVGDIFEVDILGVEVVGMEILFYNYRKEIILLYYRVIDSILEIKKYL